MFKDVKKLLLDVWKIALFHGVRRATRYVFSSLILIAGRMFRMRRISKKVHNYKMLLNLNDGGISSGLFLFGTREEQLRYILERELMPGNRVIDLGANIGYYAIMEWSIVGPEGKIFALEPSPENVSLLKQNVLLNNAQETIEVCQLAGGAGISKEKFFLATQSNLNTFIPELYRCGDRSKSITDNFIMVNVVDMTTFIADKGKVDFIRMDIEGFEVEVLSGLKQAIETEAFTGKIAFECHFPKYDDEKHNMRTQLQMLFSNGYRPKIMTSNDEKATKFAGRGYKPIKVIRTGIERFQGIYYNVLPADAEYFICDVGGVRDVLLVRNGQYFLQ